MKKQILLTIILLLTSSATFAQTRTFKWSNELCSFEGTYDAKKYLAAQLKDTQKLLYPNFFPSTIDPTPTKFAAVKALRVETLDAEYKQRANELNQLKNIKTAFWETARQKQLKEIEEVYQLSRASIHGYENPTRLKDVKFAGACVQNYAEPLIKGGDDLLAAWLSVNQETRKKNGSPERIENIYNEQFNSPERMQYAQTEVMAFGWWNCVNALIDRNQDNSPSEKEFKKLFVKTKEVSCDGP